jgi:single-stranded-DNA-specific exonuclease
MPENFINGFKYRWQLPLNLNSETTILAGKFNLSIPIIQTLFTRGYVNAESIERFLFVDKERDIAHPSLLKDSKKAIKRLIKAIEKQEKILICGDYDVDGITAAALMLSCLLPLKASINFFLPNRQEGYGLSAKTIERAHKNNYKVVITVDNGITSFEAALKAKKLGIDLIITDHHKTHKFLPKAYAIVNPQQKSCSYPYKNFAGVGVAFKLMTLLYEELKLPLPKNVYELLLLGTVADVVPLTGENRFWVRQGLNYTREEESLALRVLKQGAKINKTNISTNDIGFFIAPQLNALGRLEDPRDGVKFLLSSNLEEAERIGKILTNLNETRKAIERTIVSEIEQNLKNYNISKEKAIVESSTKWPVGIIGLAASRIVNTYNRPTFLFHISADGIAKGSARSVQNFNLFSALTEVEDLLIGFGGHAAAAGLSLKADLLPKFKERMAEIISTKLKEEDFQPSLNLDAEISLREVTNKFSQDLNYLEPFGCENPMPTFLIRDVSIVGEPNLFKDSHVKCTVFSEGILKPVIFFNRPELFKILNKLKTDFNESTCNLAVQIIENNWSGDVKIELQGIDIEIKKQEQSS